MSNQSVLSHVTCRSVLAEAWYSMSYLYYSAVGFLATVIGGLLITLLTGEMGWLLDHHLAIMLKLKHLSLATLKKSQSCLILCLFQKSQPKHTKPDCAIHYFMSASDVLALFTGSACCLFAGPTKPQDVKPGLIRPVCDLFCFCSKKYRTMCWCGVNHAEDKVVRHPVDTD